MNNREMADLRTFKQVKEAVTGGLSVHFEGEGGETLLHKAVEYGEAETVNYLIAEGADVNAKTCYGGTPLHATAYSVKAATTIAAILVLNGAEVSPIDDLGHTPMDSARLLGKGDVVILLAGMLEEPWEIPKRLGKC